MNQAMQNGATKARAWMDHMTGCTVAAKEQVKQCLINKGSLSELTSELDKSTFSTKINTVALQTLSTVGNTLLFLGIAKGIELAAKGIDNFVHSTEHCKERANELISSYQSAIDTANSNATTAEDLSSRYETLSQGVNNLGENVSLTTEEYLEYNNIVNQIADMFPTLVQGYTEEGNAILSLKGNVEQLRGAYKEAQQEAYNMLITSGEDSDGNDIIKNWNNLNKTSFDFGSINVGKGISYNDAIKTLNAVKNMSYEDYWDARVATTNTLYDKLSKEQKLVRDHMTFLDDNLDADFQNEDTYAQYQQEAKVLVQTYNAEVESRLSDVETLANAYLMTNEDYDKLNKESKNAASIIVNSLNANIASGFHSKEDVGTYVDKIVQLISTNPEARSALIGLLTLDTTDIPVNRIQSAIEPYINTIAKFLNEDPIELKTRIGFDDANTQILINNVKEKLKGTEFDDKVEELSFSDLQTAAGLDIDNDTILSWDELIQKIKEAKNTFNKTDTSSPLSFQESWNALGTTEDYDNRQAAQEAKEQLLELAEAGRLTAEELQNSPAGKTIMEQTKLSAEEATEAVNALTDRTSQLSTMKSGIQSISDILAQKREYKSSKKTENNGISPDVLAGVDDGIKEMDSWKHFEETLGNGKKSMEECQQAAAKLASEWINSNNFLTGLNKTSEDYYISALKGMGIANAEDIILSQLIAKGEDVTVGKLSLKEAMDKVQSAESSSSEETRENIACLQQEMGWTNNVASALELLYIKENILNNSSLGADTRVQELQKWAKALLGTAVAAEILEEANSAAANASTTGSDTLARQKAYNKTYEEKFREKLGKIGFDEIFDKSSKKKKKSPAGSNGTPNNPPQKTKQSFDWLDRYITILSQRIDLLKAKLENLFSVNAKNNNLTKQIKAVNKEIKAYSKEASIYSQKANAYAANKNSKGKRNISKSLQKQIDSGKFKGKTYGQLVKEYDEKDANKIQKYMDLKDKAATAEQNKAQARKTKRDLQIQKRQNWVDYYDTLSSQYDAQIENAATATQKNELENEKIKSIQKSYNYQIKIAKLEQNSIKAATLLAQKWQEIAKTREQILQNSLEENADKRDYYNAAYENADNAAKKALIQKNIDSYNGDNQTYAVNMQSAQDDVNTANKDVSKTAKAVTAQMKKEGLNKSTMKEIQSYLSSGKKIPDKHLNGTRVMLPELYKKLVAYNNSIDAVGIAKDALAKAQENQQKALEENATAIREEKSKSIQLDIDAASNQKDRLTAEYSNLTSADAKNKNIDEQLQQQLAIHNLTRDKLQNDITDPAELNAAIAKEDAEWISTQREQNVLKLQNLADEESAQYNLNQQQEANAESAAKKNELEAESRKHLKSQYDYEIQIAKENGDRVEQERLLLEQEQKIEESYQKQIDNIREEYDLLIGLNDAQKSTIDAQIAALQANGYGVGTELYQIQMSLDRDSYKQSLKEIERISAELPNLRGDARKQAEMELEAEKQKAWEYQKNLGELQQTINDINLSKLERIGTMLGYYAENLEYIQDILSHSDFTLSDKEDGGMSMEGLANIAVTFAQISNNQEQLGNLYAQLAEKRRQLAESNVENGDQLLEEINTLVQQTHNLEKANYDFGDSIKTMVIDSLNSLSDALDENISKYKESLQAQKDLYDYRKKVSDQLKSIASLEKQLAALQGSDTEEARARIQKLQIQLEEEHQNLKDMEYDKYIQDQEEMLDKVSEDFQDFIASVAEMNVSEICAAMKTVVSDNLPAITSSIENAFIESSKIGDLATSINGLKETMEKLNFSGNITTRTDENGDIHYGYTDENGNKVETTVNNSDKPGTVTDFTVNGKPVPLPKKEVTNTGGKIDKATGSQHTKSNTGPKQKIAGEQYQKEKEMRNAINNLLTNADSYINNGSSRMSYDPLNQYIYPKYNKMLDPDQEDILLKNLDIDGNSSERKSLYEAREKIKKLGFSQGGIVSDLNKIALSNGDDGWATLKRGEAVLTPAQTEQLQKLAENLLPRNTVASSIASLPGNPIPTQHSSAATNTTVRNVDIHLDGSHVMDADSFIQTLHNPRVLREVSSGVSSQLNSVMSNKLGNF